MTEQPERFIFSLTTDERAILTALRERWGLSTLAAVLRRLIKDAGDPQEEAAAPKPRRPAPGAIAVRERPAPVSDTGYRPPFGRAAMAPGSRLKGGPKKG